MKHARQGMSYKSDYKPYSQLFDSQGLDKSFPQSKLNDKYRHYALCARNIARAIKSIAIPPFPGAPVIPVSSTSEFSFNPVSGIPCSYPSAVIPGLDIIIPASVPLDYYYNLYYNMK